MTYISAYLVSNKEDGADYTLQYYFSNLKRMKYV